MMKTTRAAVLETLGAPLLLQDLELPELQAGQVTVEIAFSGVCHTQLSEARGRRGEDRFLPHALGHEGSGTVIDTGPGVTKVKVGDQVVLSWIKGIGADVPGTTYKCGNRVVNSGAICTFMERAVVSENRCTPLPAGMPLREAALLGCAVQTGAGIVCNRLHVQPGQSVVVIGAGGIGTSAIMMASAVGAAPIIAVDISKQKLETAATFGATHVIDATATNPLEAILDICKNGTDYAIEAAGRPATMELALKAVRNNGGIAVLAGNLHAGEQISIDPFDLIRGRQIVGSWGGDGHPDEDIPRYADLYKSGKLPLHLMITRTYALDEVNEALDDLESGRVLRAVIENRP